MSKRRYYFSLLTMSTAAAIVYVGGIRLQEQSNAAAVKHCTGIYKVVSSSTAFGPVKRCVSIVQSDGPSLPLQP
jgi:hypothetical protein